MISSRVNNIKPSLTIATNMKAQELKRAGKDIIVLAAGEPDFDTPDHIKDYAVKAINNGFTKYTQVDGIYDLKKAIVNKFSKENNLSFDIENISVGAGGKHVIYNLFMASLDLNDEVIIPAPYWVSYPDIVSLCGGKPVIVDTKIEDDFKITSSELEKNISKNTKWFIINSPGNPTGSVYTEEELKKISEVLAKYPHVNILSDDIYEHIIYNPEKFLNIVNVNSSLKNRTFIVNGVSKVFSMTGWRIGYGAGDINFIRSMAKLQSQSTTNPCSISQMAAKHALETDKDFLTEWIKKFGERRDFLLNFFESINGLRPFNPKGAFYLYVSCEGFINKKNNKNQVISNDLDFAEYLLDYAKVAVVPGVAFGKSPYFRLSYATSFDDLKEACERIRIALKDFDL